jgi:hypothetical protein
MRKKMGRRMKMRMVVVVGGGDKVWAETKRCYSKKTGS